MVAAFGSAVMVKVTVLSYLVLLATPLMPIAALRLATLAYKK